MSTLQQHTNQDRADEIASHRGAKGWTQAELAERARVSPRTVRNLEAGHGAQPATIARVYHALGLTTRPEFPPDVETFLQMVGYRLTSASDEERADLVVAVTKLLIGR